VYQKVGDLLLEVCTPDRVLILERDDSADGLRLAYRGLPSGAEPLDRNRTISRTITRKVIDDRVTLLSSNASMDPALAHGQSIVLQQLRSVICAPLLVRNELQGLIYIDQGKIAAFSDDDLDVVNAVAAETAIALENVHALARLTREAQARAAYSRFLPAHVVENLLHRPESLQLGGANQQATILFADLRGFTRLSALYDPEQVVAMLNEYFGAMSEIIFEHGGTLDKYIGDGLMALFGAPYAGPDDPINAVAAAVAMQKRMAVMKQQFQAKAERWQELNIGIGINTGIVTVGYVGSARRLDYTAIGDPVNMASRLENHAPPGMIYLSQSTYEGLQGRFECRPLQLVVKGRDEPLDCYQVLAD
jgi:adenylate cyclase